MTDLQQELAAAKARAAARKQEVWAEAEAAYDAWYKDLGARAWKNTKGHPGANYGVQLQTSPRCYCGKETAALGLCNNHYSQFWRKKMGPTRGRRNMTPVCHPDRPYYRKGLCKECFRPEAARRAKFDKLRRAEKDYLLSLPKLPRATKKNKARYAWKCEHTDRRHHGWGLCVQCNKKRWRYAQNPNINPHALERGITYTICGHVPGPRKRDKPIKGWCRKCYDQQYNKAWWRRKIGRRKHKRLPHHPEVWCAHPWRPHRAKHCCGSCHTLGKWKAPGFMLGIHVQRAKTA